MRGIPFRYIRAFLVLAALLAVVIFVASYFMRAEVIKRLRSLAVASASVVVSKPFLLASGMNADRSHFANRLQRLGYQKVSAAPSRPGQWSRSSGELTVYLREAVLTTGETQTEQLVRLELQQDGTVLSIKSAASPTSPYRQVERAWLESETLSLLGNDPTRASTPRNLSDFPPRLINALLSIEDERFYHHFGVDPVGIGRAIYINMRSGRVVQGGSTLTQQLAKNLFFTPRRDLGRKLFEAFAAVLIETAFTKQQILEFYLNEVFLGQEGSVAIHGFAEASRSFFGKEVEQLSLGEAATLAGIISAPTKYSPRFHPDRAQQRRLLVLDKMRELNYITADEETRARDEKINIIPPQRSARRSPYFVDYVRRQLTAILETERPEKETLRVISSIDAEYQLCADQAIEQGLEQLETSHKGLRSTTSPLQAALVAVLPASGEPVAWVGGREYGQNQFDRVSLAKRQPGSAFKPFVYLTALDGSLNSYRVARTTNLLSDEPVTIDIPGSGSWQPENYDHQYRGEVSVREALTHSLNLPTIDLAMKVGIDSVARTAALFGFGENLPHVPSLALGAGEVTPLEMAQAYAVLANGGLRNELHPILAVVAGENPAPLFTPQLREKRIASEPAVYVLTTMLQSVIESGTGNVVRRLGFTQPAAGKTGTTNDARDSWFAGFTPRLLAVVWVGFDDNRKFGLTGAQAAAPIWTNFMKCAAAMEPTLDFVPPPGVVFREIDNESGLLVTDGCPMSSRRNEVFVEGTEPVTPCPLHQAGSYVPENTEALPPAQRTDHDFNADRVYPHQENRPSRKPERSFWDRFWNAH